MDELEKALGFRVEQAGDAWRIVYSDGRVQPCLYPPVWALWTLVRDLYAPQS